MLFHLLAVSNIHDDSTIEMQDIASGPGVNEQHILSDRVKRPDKFEIDGKGRLCMDFCAVSCSELNGDVTYECAGCSQDYSCHPDASDYFDTNRMDTPDQLLVETSDSLGAFDKTHGCDTSELGSCNRVGTACEDAYCSAQKLLITDLPAHSLVKYPSKFIVHESFAVREIAFELLRLRCIQKEYVQTLETPACIAMALNLTESHDIGVRWMGVEFAEQLIMQHGLSVASKTFARRDLERRASHAQPGTRWMALYASARLGESRMAETMLAGDMGFPGIGLLAAEALGRLRKISSIAPSPKDGTNAHLIYLLQKYSAWIASGCPQMPHSNWQGANQAYSIALSAYNSANRNMEEMIHRPSALLTRIRSDGASEAAVVLCLRYLEGYDEDTLPSELRGPQQRLRWEALLTLPFASPAGHFIARGAALQMLKADGMRPHMVMKRYTGMKVLQMLAPPGDEDVVLAMFELVHDEIDVLKMQASDWISENVAPEIITRHLDFGDAYTRFAFRSTLRKALQLHCPDSAVKFTRERKFNSCEQSSLQVDGSGQVKENVNAVDLLKTSIGMLGKHLPHLRSHILVQLRTLPAAVRALAFQLEPRCDLHDLSRARRSGALYMERALSEEARMEILEHFNLLIANHSRDSRMWTFYGRKSFRGGVDSQEELRQRVPVAEDELHRLTNSLYSNRTILGLYERHGKLQGSAPVPQVIEYLEIDPTVQAATCKSEDWTRCATDWHVDGGDRPYKLWTMLQKKQLAQSNILVSPFDNIIRLQEHALRINATFDGDRDLGIPPIDTMVSITRTDANEATKTRVSQSAIELHAQQLDREVLEAASCTVHASPGDAVLLFPELFHRTQNLKAERMAAIIETF